MKAERKETGAKGKPAATRTPASSTKAETEVRLLAKDIRTEKDGSLKCPFADIYLFVKKDHKVCGDSAFAYVDEDKAIIAVFDGVSGEPAADVASTLAALAILSHLRKLSVVRKEDMVEAMTRAHEEMIQGSTTAAVAVIRKDGTYVAGSVGDSSVYSRTAMGQVGLEVSPERAVNEGDQLMRYLLYRNMVLSALGVQGEMQVRTQEGRMKKGDAIILATDAVHDNLVIQLKDGGIRDLTGTDDLERMLAQREGARNIAMTIKKEILSRMEKKIDRRTPSEALITKPDDMAIVVLEYTAGKS